MPLPCEEDNWLNEFNATRHAMKGNGNHHIIFPRNAILQNLEEWLQ